MELEDTSDTIIQQPNNSKSPKKLDRWAYEKIESLLREQIRNLKDENFYLKEQISLLRVMENKTQEPTPPIFINKEPLPVGNKTLSPAQMEQIERERYWKAEIERREKEANQPENSNTITVEE